MTGIYQTHEVVLALILFLISSIIFVLEPDNNKTANVTQCKKKTQRYIRAFSVNYDFVILSCLTMTEMLYEEE